MLWTIRRRDAGDEHIGNVAAYVDMPNRVADVSILLGEKSVWGMGFGREAFACVCAYLFNSCNVRKVTAGTMSENTAMLAIMRGIGMTEEGRRTRQFLLDGREVDMVYGCLFEWNSTITE